MEVIAEAGKRLREFAPLEDVNLKGLVVKLESERTGDGLIATVRGKVAGSNRLVRVAVKEADRWAAIRAFQYRLKIAASGDVNREGKVLVMPEYAAITVEESTK